MKSFHKELLKGSTALLALKMLNMKDMYGYELIKAVKSITEEQIQLKEGSVYPMLQILETDGYIESYWVDAEKERRRKYYHLTDRGKGYLEELLEEWSRYSNSINRVVQAGGTD